LNSATFRRCQCRRDRWQAVDFLQGEAETSAGFSHDYLADSRQYVQEGNQLAIARLCADRHLPGAGGRFEPARPAGDHVSVPMAIVGALLRCSSGPPMNIYTQVGLLTLVGRSASLAS
jgi:multidrug efflux pump